MQEQMKRIRPREGKGTSYIAGCEGKSGGGVIATTREEKEGSADWKLGKGER